MNAVVRPVRRARRGRFPCRATIPYHIGPRCWARSPTASPRCRDSSRVRTVSGTLRAVAALGAEVTRKGPGHFVIQGVGDEGLHGAGRRGGLRELRDNLRGSFVGVLAGQPFATVLTGDESLRRRPMERVMEPLSRRWARASSAGAGGAPAAAGDRRCPTALIRSGTSPRWRAPRSIPRCSSPGSGASGPVSVVEPARSRDHTERMLAAFGGGHPGRTTRRSRWFPGRRLTGRLCRVPGDISSAAFFLVAAAARRRWECRRARGGGEPDADRSARRPRCHGRARRRHGSGGRRGADCGLHRRPGRSSVEAEVAGPLVPRTIDEMPILAVAAACAEGPKRRPRRSRAPRQGVGSDSRHRFRARARWAW